MKEVTIVTVCPICNRTNEITVKEADFILWSAGTLVQDAFPYLSADEREMLISGICPDCWENLFSEEEEEEDEEPSDWDLEVGFDPYEGGYTWDC